MQATRTIVGGMAAIVLGVGAGVMAQQAAVPVAPVVGRSVVATPLGIVAASQPLAARAGVQILERGGNAIDAAIAANATMGLMEPTGNGLGGRSLHPLLRSEVRDRARLNASGWAPTGLTPDFLAGKGVKEMPQRGIYSVYVPGRRRWEAMREKFGTKPFTELLAPAIYYAEQGFPVAEVVAGGWARSVDLHKAHPELARHLSHRRRAGAAGRRGVQEPRSRRVVEADRRARARRLLHRSHRRGHPRHFQGAGRHLHGRRPGRVPPEVGDSRDAASGADSTLRATAARLAAMLHPFTDGAFAELFRQPTSTTPDSHLVVWSLRELPEPLRPVGTLLALDAIWTRVTDPADRWPRLVVVDEAWLLLQQPAGAQFLLRAAKSGRKHWAGLTIATQDTADVLGTELGPGGGHQRRHPDPAPPSPASHRRRRRHLRALRGRTRVPALRRPRARAAVRRGRIGSPSPPQRPIPSTS